MRWQWIFWNEFPPRRVEHEDADNCGHGLCYIVFAERFFLLNGTLSHRTLLRCWNCNVYCSLPKTWEHVGYTV